MMRTAGIALACAVALSGCAALDTSELQAAGVEMHALSNYPSWYRMLDEVTGLSRFLKWSFVSCKTQHRTPQPEAFRGAARSLGRAASDCVFVDDREKNCEGARAVGMPAIHFESAEQLRRELIALGYPLEASPA